MSFHGEKCKYICKDTSLLKQTLVYLPNFTQTLLLRFELFLLPLPSWVGGAGVNPACPMMPYLGRRQQSRRGS